MLKKIKPYFTHLSKKQKIKWCVSIVLLIWFWFSLPSTLFTAPTSFVITDKDGNLLNACIASDGQWRFPYNNAVPEKFIKCITTFEDKRFYYHFGIDPIAIARAIKQNIGNKKTVSGGSTITMQVIRLYKQNNKRNIFNKITESLLALRLECSYKKKNILALYASNAPFGSNVVGLDAAAWRYFGRPATQLSWGEMAALAVLPNAPALVHPGKNKQILLRKRNELLDKLLANKTIDTTTCTLAKLEPLPNEPKALPQFAPHLLDRFKKDFASLKKENLNQATALQTTIDATLQQQVNNILLQHYPSLKGNQIKNAAAIVVEIETGNVLSYIGNIYNPKDSSMESHVDVLASQRSPGSTLKPLLYASLLTEGNFLPTQLVPDIPTQIGGYTPQNFDLGYDGAVPANRALARSLNIPAVKMLQQYKYQKFYDVLKQCGFTTLHNPADFYGMSLILGGCEINPLELVGVYASMARMYNHQQKNKGKWNSEDWRIPNYFISKTKDPRLKTKDQQLFDYTSLYHTFTAMNEVMRPGEEGLWNLFSSAQRIAWKTGTSFGFRDGWSVGFTPKYAVLVWVGNTTGEGRPELIGIKTAAPIMFDIFRILPTSNWFSSPSSGFTYIPVCHFSGFKTTEDCKKVDTILVGEQAQNASNCPYCRKIHLDKASQFRVNESCESPNEMVHTSWFILPPTMEFYYKQKHSDYVALPPFKNGCIIDAAKVLDIIYPEQNAKIYVPVEITGEKGRTIFTATHKNNNAKLFWHVDNNFIGITEHLHQIALNPTIGNHVITIVDEDGNTITRNFEVMQK
jgi:penicillin-binding protein 1C